MSTYNPVTPTAHEKSEWSRFAAAAYAAGFNKLGHRFSAAAARPDGETMSPDIFDGLQKHYRSWLTRNEFRRPFVSPHSDEIVVAVFVGSNLARVELEDGEPVTIGDMSPEMLAAAEAAKV